ncbi:MAG: hypothetical protein HY238_07590, partial [Acidobacteria bacterium]|nr:hypothetical protein [Acidobacteriota bacterium]
MRRGARTLRAAPGLVSAILLISVMASAGLHAQSKPQTVKEDNYPMRAGCSDTAEQVAALKKGDPVRIRYALASSNRPCYAVSVETGGKKLQGYVWADGLTGLEEFEQARRAASSAVSLAGGPIINRGEVEAVRERAAATQKAGKIDFALAAQLNLAADALQAGRPADAEKILAKAGAPRGNRDVALLRAFALLQTHQPDWAIDILTSGYRWPSRADAFAAGRRPAAGRR